MKRMPLGGRIDFSWRTTSGPLLSRNTTSATTTSIPLDDVRYHSTAPCGVSLSTTRIWLRSRIADKAIRVFPSSSSRSTVGVCPPTGEVRMESGSFANLCHLLFQALWAHPVREVRLTMARDKALRLIPRAVGVANLLAEHADGQESSKTCQLALSGLVRCPLGFNALGNVNAATDIAAEFAGLPQEWNAAIKNPTIGAILAFQAVMHLEYLTSAKGTEIGLQAVR